MQSATVSASTTRAPVASQRDLDDMAAIGGLQPIDPIWPAWRIHRKRFVLSVKQGFPVAPEPWPQILREKQRQLRKARGRGQLRGLSLELSQQSRSADQRIVAEFGDVARLVLSCARSGSPGRHGFA